MNDTKVIQILIADDHLMVRRKGLSILIQTCPDFALAGEAENGKQAIAMYRSLRPDVVLMDIVMPEVDGIEAIRSICAEDLNAHIIALTSFPDQYLIGQALKAGARGFLYKDVGVSELINAIHQADGGHIVLSADSLAVLMSKSESPQNGEERGVHGDIKLSRREKDVLKLLVEGKTTKQIAASLHIQPSTVKQALSGLYQKIGASNRTEAVSIALREKIYTE